MNNVNQEKISFEFHRTFAVAVNSKGKVLFVQPELTREEQKEMDGLHISPLVNWSLPSWDFKCISDGMYANDMCNDLAHLTDTVSYKCGPKIITAVRQEPGYSHYYQEHYHRVPIEDEVAHRKMYIHDVKYKTRWLAPTEMDKAVEKGSVLFPFSIGGWIQDIVNDKWPKGRVFDLNLIEPVNLEDFFNAEAINRENSRFTIFTDLQ